MAELATERKLGRQWWPQLAAVQAALPQANPSADLSELLEQLATRQPAARQPPEPGEAAEPHAGRHPHRQAAKQPRHRDAELASAFRVVKG